MESSLKCIKQRGFEKTTMGDIAKEAGISRPTLYKYYKSKDEMFYGGIDLMALNFAEEVVKHSRKFESYEERVVEIIVFVVSELPKHEYLSLIFDTECSALLKERAFSAEETRLFSEMTAEPLIELRPSIHKEGVEITEMMSRFAISIIMFPGVYGNDKKELRRLIKKRLLPGLI
jgi:AcrR family transcriptional regulator